MTEELKLIIDLFSQVKEGALIGGITWLALDFLATLVPWAVGCFLGAKLINRLPLIKRREKQ